MEREGERFIEELEARNAEVERYTYTASHDLKTPLYTIQGFTGTVRKDLRAGHLERADGDLERIVAASRAMEGSLNDLLQLSRIGRVVHPSRVESEGVGEGATFCFTLPPRQSSRKES